MTRKKYHFDVGFNSENWQMQEGSHQKEGRATLTYEYPRKPACFQWKTGPKVHVFQAVWCQNWCRLWGKAMAEQSLTSVESTVKTVLTEVSKDRGGLAHYAKVFFPYHKWSSDTAQLISPPRDHANTYFFITISVIISRSHEFQGR